MAKRKKPPGQNDLIREILALLAQGRKIEAMKKMITQDGIVYAYCLSELRREDLAKEALQETYKSAWTSLESYEGRSKPSTWLIGVAKHRCTDIRRKLLNEIPTEPFDPELHDGPQTEPGTEPQLVQAVRSCIMRLPDSVRSAVTLHFTYGLSYVEMEDITGVRAPTLQARVARALPKLKGCLERKGWRP